MAYSLSTLLGQTNNGGSWWMKSKRTERLCAVNFPLERERLLLSFLISLFFNLWTDEFILPLVINYYTDLVIVYRYIIHITWLVKYVSVTKKGGLWLCFEEILQENSDNLEFYVRSNKCCSLNENPKTKADETWHLKTAWVHCLSVNNESAPTVFFFVVFFSSLSLFGVCQTGRSWSFFFLQPLQLR